MSELLLERPPSALIPDENTVLGKRKPESTARLTVDASTNPTYVLNVLQNQSEGVIGEERWKNHGVVANAVAGPSGASLIGATPRPARSRSASQASTRRRSYFCSWEGCDKAYTKPCRLEEHYRSHTGDRPFRCETCGKSFLRKVHLQAHTRSHASTDERPLVCTVDEKCGKRFWTQQQLRVHEDMHRGAKPYICSEAGCNQGFAKHSQLRSHVAEAHYPPGTKPFRCEHQDCTKSFSTTQKLRAHLRTHDEDRYACYEANCINDTGTTRPLHFQTWTELQTHLRVVHPPTCPHPECRGKTFSEAHALKVHLRAHDGHPRCKRNDNVDAAGQEEEDGEENDDDTPSIKRRKLRDLSGAFVCMEDDCDQSFSTTHALKAHHKVKHLGRLDFECTNAWCNKRFGYKRNLQHHLRTCREPSTIDRPVSSLVHDLTGKTPSNVMEARKRSLTCPWTGSSEDENEVCGRVFGQYYDLQRHLKASHGIEVDRDQVEALFTTK